jgi:hypothetical protein
MSATYADDFVDEKPVEKPETELPADVFNLMKGDLAYVARTCFRLVVILDSSANVEAIYGPEGVQASDIVASFDGTDNFAIDWSATGVVSPFAQCIAREGGMNFFPATRTSTTLGGRCYDPGGGSGAAPLALVVF